MIGVDERTAPIRVLVVDDEPLARRNVTVLLRGDPDMESIADVLEYVRSRASVVPEGEWISVNQVFITRLREQRDQFAVAAGEAGGTRVSGSGGDRAAGHKAMTASVRLHAAVAGALGAGIDADDSHAREASISFSSMSKLAHTCCTSSWSSRASINFSITWASLPCSFT